MPVVDLQQRLLTIDPPAGLLDLAAVPKQPKGKKTRALGNARSSEAAPGSSSDVPSPAHTPDASGHAGPSDGHDLDEGHRTE